MKKYLTSYGYVLLNLILFIALIVVSILITFFADDFILIACIFSWSVSIGLLFGLYVCFRHKIIICDKYIIFQNIKTHKFSYEDIIDVNMYNDFRTIDIITKEKTFYFPGYFVLFSNKKALKLTQELVKEIRKKLK